MGRKIAMVEVLRTKGCSFFVNPQVNMYLQRKGLKTGKMKNSVKRGMLMSHNESNGHQYACLKTVNYQEIVSNEKKYICVLFQKATKKR